MGLDPKVFQKLPLGLNKKQQANFENVERGKAMKEKKKAFRQNIKRKYQKPHGHRLISKARLHGKHLHLKPFAKK